MSLMGQHWLFAALAIIDAVLEKMHLKGHIDERCLRDLDPYKREYLKEDTVSPAAEHSIVPCGNRATARRSSGTPRPPQASSTTTSSRPWPTKRTAVASASWSCSRPTTETSTSSASRTRRRWRAKASRGRRPRCPWTGRRRRNARRSTRRSTLASKIRRRTSLPEF